MDRKGKTTVEIIKAPRPVLGDSDHSDQYDFAAALLKRRKLEKMSNAASSYTDTRRLIPSSNLLERFFSTAKYACR